MNQISNFKSIGYVCAFIKKQHILYMQWSSLFFCIDSQVSSQQLLSICFHKLILEEVLIWLIHLFTRNFIFKLFGPALGGAQQLLLLTWIDILVMITFDLACRSECIVSPFELNLICAKLTLPLDCLRSDMR